jgi:hypothetical protein
MIKSITTKNYTKLVHNLFLDMFKTLYPNELNTYLNKISGQRKLFTRLMTDIKKEHIEKKRNCRRILKRKIKLYLIQVRKDRLAQSDRFWKSYPYFKDVIDRSFTYLIRRYFPNYSGQEEQDSYNGLILALESQDIFNIKKFDPEKYKKSETPVSKRYEHFIYNRIYSYLNREYCERRIRSAKFKRTISDIHTGSYNPSLEPLEMNDLINADMLPKNQKEIHLKKIDKSNRQAKESYVPVDPYNGLPGITEDLEEQELWQNILKVCKNDKERQIVSYKKNGLSGVDIGKIFGVQAYEIIKDLGKIHSRLNNILVPT